MQKFVLINIELLFLCWQWIKYNLLGVFQLPLCCTMKTFAFNVTVFVLGHIVVLFSISSQKFVCNWSVCNCV